jgi:hypothetical protein
MRLVSAITAGRSEQVWVRPAPTSTADVPNVRIRAMTWLPRDKHRDVQTAVANAARQILVEGGDAA